MGLDEHLVMGVGVNDEEVALAEMVDAFGVHFEDVRDCGMVAAE